MPEGRQILMAMFQGGGNIPLLLPIVARLVTRGHRIRVLVGPGVRRARLPVSASLWQSLTRSSRWRSSTRSVRQGQELCHTAGVERTRGTSCVPVRPGAQPDGLRPRSAVPWSESMPHPVPNQSLQPTPSSVVSLLGDGRESPLAVTWA
jgi:hypothetical protein